MPTSFLSKLNLAVVSGFERAVSGQQSSINSLLGRKKLFSQNPVLVLPYSTICSAKAKPYTMASSNSAPVFGDVHVDNLITGCGNGLDVAKLGGVFFDDGNRTRCQRAALSLRRMSSRFVLGDIKGRNRCSDSFIGTRPLACYSTGAAHDVSFDGSAPNEQNPNLTASSDLDRTLKLVSGVCNLPHPDKEATGGEDAYFICTDEQAIGVADGVGGWADVGVNAGLFSTQLMSNSVAAIRDEPKGLIDPARVLEKAHAGMSAKGSSTACIVALTDKGLHAINLGDSGFIVVRDGCTIFQSPVQQHGFNFTFQLETGSGGDLPSSGQVFTIPVAVGDVIVAGTDGLFDNLYNNEITAVVLHAVRAGLEPSAMAQKIAAMARQRAMDKTRQTPFATAAQEAGFRYYGGKLDDITVVVSYVAASVYA